MYTCSYLKITNEWEKVSRAPRDLLWIASRMAKKLVAYATSRPLKYTPDRRNIFDISDFDWHIIKIYFIKASKNKLGIFMHESLIFMHESLITVLRRQM